MAPHKSKSKSAGAVPPKPSRPFTEYHVFFQLERNYILQNSNSSASSSSSSEAGAEVDVTAGFAGDVDPHASTRPPRYRSLVLPRGWHTKGSRPRRRAQRKSHGRITFEELTKIVSRRWREADAVTRSYCRDVAGRELKRYREEMREYVERYGAVEKKKKPRDGKRKKGQQGQGQGQAGGSKKEKKWQMRDGKLNLNVVEEPSKDKDRATAPDPRGTKAATTKNQMAAGGEGANGLRPSQDRDRGLPQTGPSPNNMRTMAGDHPSQLGWQQTMSQQQMQEQQLMWMGCVQGQLAEMRRQLQSRLNMVDDMHRQAMMMTTMQQRHARFGNSMLPEMPGMMPGLSSGRNNGPKGPGRKLSRRQRLTRERGQQLPPLFEEHEQEHEALPAAEDGYNHGVWRYLDNANKHRRPNKSDDLEQRVKLPFSPGQSRRSRPCGLRPPAVEDLGRPTPSNDSDQRTKLPFSPGQSCINRLASQGIDRGKNSTSIPGLSPHFSFENPFDGDPLEHAGGGIVNSPSKVFDECSVDCSVLDAQIRSPLPSPTPEKAAGDVGSPPTSKKSPGSPPGDDDGISPPSPTPDYNIAPEISFLAKNFVNEFSRYLDHDHEVQRGELDALDHQRAEKNALKGALNGNAGGDEAKGKQDSSWGGMLYCGLVAGDKASPTPAKPGASKTSCPNGVSKSESRISPVDAGFDKSPIPTHKKNRPDAFPGGWSPMTKKQKQLGGTVPHKGAMSRNESDGDFQAWLEDWPRQPLPAMDHGGVVKAGRQTRLGGLPGGDDPFPDAAQGEFQPWLNDVWT